MDHNAIYCVSYEYKTGTTYTQTGGRVWNRDLVVIWETYPNEGSVSGGQQHLRLFPIPVRRDLIFKKM